MLKGLKEAWKESYWGAYQRREILGELGLERFERNLIGEFKGDHLRGTWALKEA